MTAWPLPCTMEARALPDGSTTREGRPFEFRLADRGADGLLEVPGQWRGPDWCEPDEPDQVRWLVGLERAGHLRSVASAAWEVQPGGVAALAAALDEHLLAPTAAEQAALTAARRLCTSDPAAGLRRVDALLADAPDRAELRFLRGRVLGDQRDRAGAVAAFDACVARQPAHGEAWIQAGYHRIFDEAAWSEALACFERAAALLPRSTTAGYHLARQLARVGRLEDAADEMARTIDLAPAPPDSYLHRARWLAALDRVPEALACLDASPHQPASVGALRERLEALG